MLAELPGKGRITVGCDQAYDTKEFVWQIRSSRRHAARGTTVYIRQRNSTSTTLIKSELQILAANLAALLGIRSVTQIEADFHCSRLLVVDTVPKRPEWETW